MTIYTTNMQSRDLIDLKSVLKIYKIPHNREVSNSRSLICHSVLISLTILIAKHACSREQFLSYALFNNLPSFKEASYLSTRFRDFAQSFNWRLYQFVHLKKLPCTFAVLSPIFSRLFSSVLLVQHHLLPPLSFGSSPRNFN